MNWEVLNINPGPPPEALLATIPLFTQGLESLAKHPSSSPSDLETMASPSSPDLGDKVEKGSLMESFAILQYQTDSEAPIPPAGKHQTTFITGSQMGIGALEIATPCPLALEVPKHLAQS